MGEGDQVREDQTGVRRGMTRAQCLVGTRRRANRLIFELLRRPLPTQHPPQYPVVRAKQPNHFLMSAWSLADFATYLFLQAWRQKLRPQ